uniref:Cubilin n=1 Tax=Bursaphelenchus xylophilus TaxID=6326 RepID=A0A1I7RXF4_BURXY
MGPHCEKRFDECAMIKGTHADCQNGGTCVNNEKGPGTTCKCPPNTYGSHCQEKSGECTATSTGLCGEHGHCVSITPSYAGAAPYKCVCDYGYRSNEDIMQPLCIDIDECAGEHTPCFKGYGNECLNLPGGFKCTGCPKGFYGDGITCEDINECYSDPCSQNPRVECINTKGSFSCAACPAGYEGDGFYCKKIEFCANNPCNEEATCIEEPNEGCLCPEDKPIGSGLKDTECHRTYYYGSGRCSVCENGATCQKINETHANCFCAPGFHGDKCEFEDKCYNEPDFCGEVGTCHRNENDAYCVCPNGFTTSCGIIPQKGVIIPPDTCGMEFIQDSGNYTMTLPFYNSEVCTLTMKSRDTRKILKVWVTNYTHSDLDPGFDNIHAVEVKLKDATNSWRYQLPTKTSPYYTKNSHLHVIFFVPTPNDTLQATVHWQAVEPICGGRLDVSNSPFSFKSSKAWEECQWFLDAPNDQLIEVTVEKMITATGAEVNCTVNSLRFYDSGLIDQNVQMGEICADVEQPYVKRFSTNHASLQFTYDSYMASEETLRDCKLSTSSTNNTDDAPRCGIYFMVSFKGVPKTTDCGGVINAQTNPVGFIQTPNFGHAYPPDLMCVWEFKLRKDPNETLSDTDLNMFTMDVVEFDVRGSNEPVPDGTVDDDIYCPGDFIEFDDITKHCNGNRLPVQLHFFDEFKLEFHSDSQYSGKGFKMLYKASCYHSYSNPTGIVRSPNLRVRHHEPFTCTYNIHAPSSAIVKLKFDYIGLPGFSVGCLQLQSSNDSSLAGYDDYIELSGGHTSDASLNRRYHCARYPFVAPSGELIVSGTSGVQITYSTSGSANNTGFLFSYTVEEKGCGGYYHGKSGVIKSPNYPNKYPNHMYCIYTIKTKGRQAVRLTFDDFDVENVASRLDCGFDAVEIYDTYQNEKKHGKLLGRQGPGRFSNHFRYCGVANPPPIVSASGTLVVVFTSDRSVNGIGFTAHYDVVNLHNFCDVTLTQQSGVLEFNRSNYGNIEECNFRIVLPAMARIHLNITDFYMPCEDGVVTLRNGGHSDSPKFPQLWPDSSFCDSKPVPELITQGNQAFISLLVKSTRNTTLRIEYKMIEQSCGGSIRGYTGEIATPQYPKADSHQLMCEWEITVAPGNRIRFQIDKMDDLASADHNGVCQPFARNYIDLAEGPRSDPTVLRKYCKREVAPEPLITSDNSLVVKYNQVGGSINGGLFGFLGRFVTVCNNIVLSKPFGSIQSPGYPYPTEEARVCSWTIRTAPGSRIKVIFHRFRLDGSMIIRSRGFTECMSNYLSVRTDQIEHVEGTEDGKATDKMKATKFCNGFAEPQRIFSKSNELQFNFTNTKQAKENHFWLSWSTEGCGDYVYSNATKLSVDVSDFVAANLSLRRECNWVMYAPIGYVIKVDVMEMHTVEQINTGVCPDKIDELNGVMFFTGTNFTDYPQWSYCGRIIGQNKTYTSHTNRLAMRLGMDAKYKTSRNGTVFRAFVTYVKLDNDLTCTGKVKVLPGHNQTITSPGFPTKYPRAIECAWQFETVKGFSLAYNLSHFVTPGKRRPPQLGFPTNIRCSSALMYIEGGLAVYSGEYARNDRLYSSYRESKGAVSRICNDITESVIFNVLTNESTVTFHGAPYDATVPSGDSGRKDKVGFVLEAFAVCGGTLEAGAERRTLSLREHMLHNNGGCAFKVTRENQTLLDQKIVVGFELLDLNAFDDDKEVFINVTCGISRKPNYASTKNRHINTVECTEDILVEVSEIPQNVTFMLHYDTVGYMCGDIGDAVKGIYEISGDIDCDYVLENSAGNKVVLHIDESTIPESEDCAQSYVEIREGKRKRLLSRLCGNISPRKYEAEKLYLRVLRKPFETADNEDDEDVPTTPAPTNWLKFRFEKSLGGVVKSNKIILPVGSPRIRPADETIVWSVRTNKSDEHIEVTFRTLIGVKVQINEEIIDSLADDEPTRVYTSNELEIKALAPRTDISHFELTWKPIRPAANGSEAVGKTVYVEEEFTCGGELEATFSPKNLTLPTSDVNKYANDLKCRWKIKRPLLHGISFKLKLLDVEEHANCAYDYLTVGTREFATLRELEDATFMHRICRKDQANYATLINYDDEAFIYFVSDRSKSFSGFTLEYKLDCRTFEYLNAEKNKFVYTLNSPLYPETGGHNFSCMWGIMLETNRDLIVKAISMDLAPPQEDNQCKGEYLLVNSVPHSNNAGNNVHYYCGNNLFNYTAKYGRVFITYENSGETQPAVRRQGFQLLIEEITHMCSETLYLDEIKKKGVIQSPGYPENSPNSLDCEWIIAAPPGHRIKFTVDTEQFMLENADPDECKDDYLEIYDGPSGSSPLIGKFCGDDPPSTLFSTDSHLFVRFVTDYYSPSEGWKATYELASCGGTVVLSPSVNTSITSPNFPEAYPAQEECEWIVKAPKGHFVEGHLKHLWLAISDNCKQEYVTVLDGLHPGVAPNTTENRTVLLPPSCSMRSVNDRHFHSHHGTALVKFMANTTYARGASRLFCLNRKCGFEIELSASKYECGGDVEDDEGQLVVPGYPDHVLPGVECVWNFKAGIGYRYKLDLEFVNEDGFYEHIPSINGGPEQPCFPDLEAWNGPVESRYSLYSLYQRFCVNRTSFVSNADIMTVVYEDRAKVYRSVMYTGIDSTRFHKPFRLRYTRVDEDFDEFACMWHVYDDQNITIHDMSIKRSYSDMMGLTNTGSKSFCHIRIENQKKESTVALYFTDFRAGRPNIRLCGQSSNQVHIVGQTLDEWPIKDVLCSGIVQHNVYNNSYNSRILDIFIMNNPFSLVPNIDQPVQFNLSIVYNQCGGDITEELYGNFGTIRAPGTQDGGNYSNNADCLWHLKAPEGLVIKLSVTKMDLEYDVYCNHDVLEVAEGLATSSQLHRYCNSELIPDTALEDRFKRLISRGRYLTLHFHSNHEINGKGFEIDWEFVTPDSNNCKCGA